MTEPTTHFWTASDGIRLAYYELGQGQPVGLLLETFEDAFVDWLDAFTMPTLVVCGSEDDDNGSAEELANVLPDAVFREIPGTHMSSVTKPELGEEIARFLAA